MKNLQQQYLRIILLCIGVTATDCFMHTALANNLSINNVSVASQNNTSHFKLIKFDIRWDNSWRVSSGAANWDAAWVFIKFRKKNTSLWKHATLNWVDGTGTSDGHITPMGGTINSSNDNGSGGSFGVFIYHNSDMAQSSVNYTDVQLRWNNGTDGINDNDSVELCIMGIEMVYVPQGAYRVGDGSSTYITGQLYDAGIYNNFSVINPYLISSENNLTLGGGTSGSVGNFNSSNMLIGDDFDDANSKNLPSLFPKGYKAFYCMKYEVTQDEYVTFLNKLPLNQQATNTEVTVPPNSATGSNVMISFGQPFRNGIVIKTPGINSTTPAEYACDLNGNGIFDEADDGHDIACNNMNWAQLCAFLDWTALRPMTELEYEKACRGNQSPVADEAAWGGPFDWRVPDGFANNGMNNEFASNTGGWWSGATPNINATDLPGYIGPTRVGSFGMGTGTRDATGATYYGIMEMSGNVFERTVSIGNATGRGFSGLHGDGILNNVSIPGYLEPGNANTTGWPDPSAVGSGFRGGAFGEADVSGIYFFPTVRVSDRFYASSPQPFALYNFGGRGVRTAPF